MGYGAVVTTMIDARVRDRLKVLAGQHGRSLEEEVNAILADAVSHVPEDAIPPRPTNQPGLGTQIAALFSGQGIGFRDGEIQEIRGARWKIPKFDE